MPTVTPETERATRTQSLMRYICCDELDYHGADPDATVAVSLTFTTSRLRDVLVEYQGTVWEFDIVNPVDGEVAITSDAGAASHEPPCYILRAALDHVGIRLTSITHD